MYNKQISAIEGRRAELQWGEYNVSERTDRIYHNLCIDRLLPAGCYIETLHTYNTQPRGIYLEGDKED